MLHANPDEIRALSSCVGEMLENTRLSLQVLHARLEWMLAETPDLALTHYHQDFTHAKARLEGALDDLALGRHRLNALATSIDHVYLAAPAAATSPTSPSWRQHTRVAGYRPGRGFETIRGNLPLTLIGADALRDHVVWDDPSFPDSFWRSTHHTFDATRYILLVDKLSRVLDLLRSNDDPERSEDKEVRDSYRSFFSDDNCVVVEKTAQGWRVTDGAHRIMACIATGITCPIRLIDSR